MRTEKEKYLLLGYLHKELYNDNARAERLKIVKGLLALDSDENNEELLSDCIFSEDITLVKYLINDKASLSTLRDSLNSAYMQSSAEILEYVLSITPDSEKFMVDHNMLLHRICTGDIEVIRALEKAGFDIRNYNLKELMTEIEDYYEYYKSNFCIKSNRRHKEVIRELTKCIYTESDKCETCIHRLEVLDGNICSYADNIDIPDKLPTEFNHYVHI